MATKKTYKDIWISSIIKDIRNLDTSTHTLRNTPFTSVNDSLNIRREILQNNIKRYKLGDLLKRSKSLHGRHFVPSRFPSAKFLSLSLTYESIKL